MKKAIFLAATCFIALTIQAQGYVDLGLSSGTKWKTENAKNASNAKYDFFTYEEAVSQFCNRLPTKAQWEELKNECQWTWTGKGYNVTGPNGNSIFLPAAGWRDCRESIGDIGYSGSYWSSSPDGSEYAWYLDFNKYGISIKGFRKCGGYSVRLVQK